MISESSKREKIANAFLATTMALSAAQSPQDFVRTGKIESPGTALMQRWGRVRGEAERNLDSGRVSHPARNRKKMKTFKEFVEEAYLYEMRKEDKVAGKKKTPLTLPVTTKHARKDESGNWKVEKLVTHRANPEAQMGRFKQGKGMPGDPVHHTYSTEGGTSRGPGFGYVPQPHGEGGALRGKKKVPGEKTERAWNDPTPAKKIADKRAKAAYRKSGGYDYRKGYGR
jgi:hypothetical protein